VIITQDTLDKIRIHFNQLAGEGRFGGEKLQSATDQRALEIAVRNAFSKVEARMELSDDEELALQALETVMAQPTPGVSNRSKVEAVIKMLRTRHATRTVRKAAGRVLHEAFHTDLNRQGESKYGEGCWDALSASRKLAWEAAAKQLATEVAHGRVQLTDTQNRPVTGVPVSFSEIFRAR
jgi:hypothetical protein